MEDWTPEDEVSPQLRHHLDQTEAWAVDTVNELARLQARFYLEAEHPVTSRLATCEEVASIITPMPEKAAKALLYVFISNAGEEVANQAVFAARLHELSDEEDNGPRD